MARNHRTNGQHHFDAELHLTDTEQRVLRLVSLGCTVKETALILERSPNTVDNHKTSVMRKLGVNDLPMLTRWAIQLNVTSLDDRLTRRERRRVKRYCIRQTDW